MSKNSFYIILITALSIGCVYYIFGQSNKVYEISGNSAKQAIFADSHSLGRTMNDIASNKVLGTQMLNIMMVKNHNDRMVLRNMVKTMMANKDMYSIMKEMLNSNNAVNKNGIVNSKNTTQ